MEQHGDSQARTGGPVRMVSAKVALAGAVVIAVLSGAVVSYAGSGPFSDVPDSHQFATEIENMANAGITGGFPDGTFRPDNPVTRASMAAFLGRGLGRASYQAFAEQEITGDATTLTLTPSAAVIPGAVGSGTNGYVVVTASIDVDRNSDTCVCQAYINIQASKNNFANIDFTSDSHNADLDTGMTYTNISHTAVVPVEAGSTYRFRVRANNNVATLHASDRTTFSGSISAIYVPYGWNGTADHIS